jgi:2-methylaconitate cis-trans-isomerase PrpF
MAVQTIDLAFLFCHAHEIRLKGTELPSEREERRRVMATLETIRSVATRRIGIVDCHRERQCA